MSPCNIWTSIRSELRILDASQHREEPKVPDLSSSRAHPHSRGSAGQFPPSHFEAMIEGIK
jgi:hypothetical protein